MLAAPAAQAAEGAELVLLGVAGGPTWYGNDAPHGISSALVVDGKAYIVDLDVYKRQAAGRPRGCRAWR